MNKGTTSITTQDLDQRLQSQRVPRYTSYPPATEFAGLPPETQQNWLTEINKDLPVSLYIHIPYCDQLCWFCGCFTSITHRYEPVAKYLDLLIQEIEWVHSITGNLRVSHLHMGGGSPTTLSAKDFTRLLAFIREKYSFDANAEIAVEIDPRTIDDSKIRAFVASGVTRASLGVQDFSLPVQEAVNRIQPYSLVEIVTNKLRDSGINKINLDLMYGLPLQTIDSVINTAQQALTLAADRLAVFGYAHVPWMRKHQCVLDEFPMADPTQRLQMFNAMKKVFTENGYETIGIDHFARHDDELTKSLHARTLRRNFQGYTSDQAETLIGFGLSSISSLSQGYIQNTLKLQDYKKALQENTAIAHRGIAISQQDKMRRTIISELMCFYNVDLKQVANQYSLDTGFESELTKLAPFFDAGLVSLDDTVLLITNNGRPYVRTVCAAFDQYLKADSSHFSLAV
ncbi:MAG: oxygen-independent coproporphyrinogen III oxidase [Gammaproteobacteria bacterium]|nr:oxygen-independent coproporphyrinogen III oxidase [Gammaproteobacteria bacterium]